ncbi:MAG: A/G-specific adenine glycosylase [SAR324 cluster bacterium]|nr:A/G-specific adenine glycosylase [SAR324 cluster bacterium]
MTPTELSLFQIQLLEWFTQQQRPLPWRQHYEPYAVWISEIMLQQTQVATVLPYFDRWMEMLPSIQAVAETSEDTILKLWEGLGYYTRARNIQKAAIMICEKHGGQIPQDFSELLALPGIGRYTAGAIASIAFNQERPIVDGNIVRVLCRLMDWRDNPRSAEMQKKIWNAAEAWIPEGNARFFNQALMELGATLCSTQAPLCLLCPVPSFCKALKANTIDAVPAKTKRPPAKQRITALAVIQNEEGELLIAKRPAEGLMGGLWEFPNINLDKDTDIEQALKQGIRQQQDILITVDQPLSIIKHAYTSFKVTLHCFLCTYQRSESDSTREEHSAQWVPLENLKQFSFPAAHGKIIQILSQERMA